MKLLCKLVTNPLKPTVCAHPINLCKSLGLGLSDLHHCIGCGRGPGLESVINFPFLPVALSCRPSLFPLRDSDIGHNKSKILKFLLNILKIIHKILIYLLMSLGHSLIASFSFLIMTCIFFLFS